MKTSKEARYSILKKGLLIGISILAFIFVHEVDAQTKLVGEWKFDKGKGLIAKDNSGYENHATIYPENEGAAWTTKGRFGSALIFDGKNDGVKINNSKSLNITGSLTVAAFFKLHKDEQKGNIITKWKEENRSWALYVIYVSIQFTKKISFFNKR